MDISPLRGYYTAHTPTLMGERGGSAVLVPLVRQDGARPGKRPSSAPCGRPGKNWVFRKAP